MAQTFFKVLAPREALELLLAVEPVGSETIPSVQGRGRVLAEDLFSAVDLPHFHRAAMDGYAVKAKDTFGASQSLPAYLRLAGVVEMGKEATQRLNNGEAIRISTGGMMPPDGVVAIAAGDAGGVHAALQEGAPDVDLLADLAVGVIQGVGQKGRQVVVEEARLAGLAVAQPAAPGVAAGADLDLGGGLARPAAA